MPARILVRYRPGGCRVRGASRFKRGLISSGLLVPLGMALMFLMNVVLARQLGPTEFGAFSYVFAAATMIALLATLGIPAATMRFVAQYADAGQWALAGGILRWSFKAILLSAVIIAMIVIVAAWEFAASDVVRRTWLFIALLTPPMVLWVWQRFASLGFHRIGLALIPRDLALPAIMTLLALLPWLDTSRAMILACAAALLALEAGAVWRMSRRLPTELCASRPEYLGGQWMMTALPLALTSIMQLGMNRWDLLVLGWDGDMRQTGLYNAAARLALLATPISRAVITFTGPLYAAAYNNGRMGELRMLKRRSLYATLAFGLPLGALLIAVPGPLTALLYGENYRAAGEALRILAAGQCVALFAVPSSTLLWMGGGERRQALIAALGAIGGLGLCILLVPLWGATGAATGTAASLAITSLLYIWAGGRVHPPQHEPSPTDQTIARPAQVRTEQNTSSENEIAL